jgi:hypothetical protein
MPCWRRFKARRVSGGHQAGSDTNQGRRHINALMRRWKWLEHDLAQSQPPFLAQSFALAHYMV